MQSSHTNSMAAELSLFEREVRMELRLFSLYLTDSLIYSDLLLLIKFLDCHSYIFPAEREILPELSDFLYSNLKRNLFSLAMKVDSISVHLNLEKQALLLQTLEAGAEKKL